MNKHLKFLATLTLAFSLAACTPINNSDTSSKEDATQDSSKDTAGSENKEENKDNSSKETKEENSEKSQDTQNKEETANKEEDSNNSSQNNSEDNGQSPTAQSEETASAIAGKLEQSYQEQGFATSTIDYDTSDTGNTIASFSAEANGNTVYVDVTSAVNNQAQDVFDANSQADEYGDLTIMNEWSNNDNIVRVIRDNMSNANFVEILDLHQQTAIHIYDETPEQLNSTLTVLQSVGYPVEI